MDIRRITPAYAVSPQITPEDAARIAAEGFATILCNRPVAEVPPQVQQDAIRAAAEAAGLTFVSHPITHATLDDAAVDRQMEVCAAAAGPVLAYCATGTRCSVVWSLGQAGTLPVDEILSAVARHGYDLEALRPRIEARATAG